MLRKLFELLFRAYYLFKLNIAESKLLKEELILDETKYKFLQINKENISIFDKELPQDKLTVFEERLNGDLYKGYMIIDIVLNKPCCFTWIRRGTKMYIKQLNRTYNFTSESAFLEDGYTFENYRKLGIFKYILHRIMKEAINNGVKRFFNIIQIYNQPSIRTVEDLGFRKTLSWPISYRPGSIKFIIQRFLNKPENK